MYTRKGDKGETGLLSGERIGKDDPRVEAYGTLDELITVLGVAKVHSSSRISEYVHSIQQLLFYVAAELATDHEECGGASGLRRVGAKDVSLLEVIADELTEELPHLSNFVIPGGTKASVFLHQARTVCRRAERRVLSLSKTTEVNPEVIRYVNRLSDLLFVMARYENLEHGEGDYLISRDGVERQTK
ncbi:MAG: cob(I)yrinic acid a,c-diamide adenosyltransferase [Candidatus Thorarchaeota archaeon]|nr:MAG: cob(I)yrinic acid a,c-diamide adenosyltransferase [Candidatus Thorarchaeota archaeon]